MVDPRRIAPHVVLDGQNYAMKQSSAGRRPLRISTTSSRRPRPRSPYYYLVDYTATEQRHRAAERRPTRAYPACGRPSLRPLAGGQPRPGRRQRQRPRPRFHAPGCHLPSTACRPAPCSPPRPRSASSSRPSRPAELPGHPRRDHGSSPVGTFRIDPINLTVTPPNLTLASGAQQSLSFSVPNPAPPGGLLIDVATDAPESVIMPEVVIPEGQTSVSVSVQGGKPGTGSLVLKGYGADGRSRCRSR